MVDEPKKNKRGAPPGTVRNPSGVNQYENPLYAQAIIAVRLYKEDDQYLRQMQNQLGEKGLIVQFIRNAVREKLESGGLEIFRLDANTASEKFSNGDR